MPRKLDYEIYNCSGVSQACKKPNSTGSWSATWNNSNDKFVVAPGIKGMVMTVFTLPSYNIVFKIIKDKFAPPKEVTHQIVREKYRLVSRHDRIGRMADTQEFDNLVFPLRSLF